MVLPAVTLLRQILTPVQNKYYTWTPNTAKKSLFLSLSSLPLSALEQQKMRVPVTLPPHPQLVLSGFSVLAILISVQWYLIVTSNPNLSHSNRCAVVFHCLISITLVKNDVENFLICLFATYISSLVQCLFKSTAHFFFGVRPGWFVFLLLSFENSLNILYT